MDEPARDAIIREALAPLDAFMAALNAGDEAGVNAAFHFPHVRIAGGTVTVFPDPGDYRLEGFLARAGDGWAESRWNRRRPVHVAADKVHFDVRFSRHRADGSLIAAFDSLWVVPRIGGRWGIQARSSFAP